MKSISMYATIPILLLVLGGCGGSSAGVHAKVSGKITYKGQPIKGGKMLFVTADGTGYPATINSDGTYSATDLPTGEMIITVETESLKKSKGTGGASEQRYTQMQGSMKAPADRAGGTPNNDELYVKIPVKYATSSTSTLTFTMKSGRNVVSFDLTD